MKNRFDLRGDLLEIRALYSVPALARIAKVSADMLRRVLRAANVELLRSGRVILVPLSEIRDKVPSLWKSLANAEELRRRAPCPHCGWDGRASSVPAGPIGSSRASRARSP
jgi:hypothetical protein